MINTADQYVEQSVWRAVYNATGSQPRWTSTSHDIQIFMSRSCCGWCIQHGFDCDGQNHYLSCSTEFVSSANVCDTFSRSVFACDNMNHIYSHLNGRSLRSNFCSWVWVAVHSTLFWRDFVAYIATVDQYFDRNVHCKAITTLNCTRILWSSIPQRLKIVSIDLMGSLHVLHGINKFVLVLRCVYFGKMEKSEPYFFFWCEWTGDTPCDFPAYISHPSSAYNPTIWQII